MISKALCLLTGHYPSRAHAKSDGYGFRAPCKRCGQAMIRRASGWRMLDRARDDMPGSAG